MSRSAWSCFMRRQMSKIAEKVARSVTRWFWGALDIVLTLFCEDYFWREARRLGFDLGVFFSISVNIYICWYIIR